MMLRIALVNVPFGAVERPSIALTQLQAVCEQRLGGRVVADIHYLNNDFARFLGPEVYGEIASGSYYATGLGDWLFREAAFPDAGDNTDAYVARYFPNARFHASIRDDHTAFLRWLRTCKVEFAKLLSEAIEGRRLAEYDLVGMTSVFSQTVACLALARQLKQRRPSILTVIGGANCEGAMGQAIARRADNVDYVFSGPALQSFPHLLELLCDGTLGGVSAGGIPGVIVGRAARADAPPGPARAGERRAVRGAPVELRPRPGAAPQLGGERPINDRLPDLSYDSYLAQFDRDLRGLGVEPTLLFETSRGCWWGEVSQCIFCGLNGMTMNYRAMEADLAVATIRSLFRYRDRCRSLMSVDNIMPRGFVDEVLPRLDPPQDVSIFYEVKANLSRSDLAVMAKAGLHEIQPGIEAVSSSLLRLMRKGTTSFRNVRLLQDCLALGIDVTWNLLVGFPRQAEQVYEHYQRSLPNLFHLQPPTGIHPIRFDRFSPYFEDPASFELQLRPADFYRLIYPYDDEAIEDICYYFTDRNLNASYRADLARWLRPLQAVVARWRERWAQGPPPRLEARVERGRLLLRESRQGPERTYALSDAEAAMLRCCQSPVRPERLVEDGARARRSGAQDALATLRSLGLLFEDDGKALSLVPLPATEEDRDAGTAARARQARDPVDLRPAPR